MNLGPWMTIDEHCFLPTQCRWVLLEKRDREREREKERERALCYFKHREFEGCLLPQHNLAYSDSSLISIMRALTLEVSIPAQTGLCGRRAVGDT